MTTASVASKVPANIGSAAFLAPEIATLPDRVAPPLISNLSNDLGLAALLPPFVRCQCCYRKCMNFVTDERTKTLIDQLMAGEQPLAVELGSDNQGSIMGVVVTLHFYDRVAESGFDQLSYLYWVHNVGYRAKSALTIIKARSVTAMYTASHCSPMIVYYSRPATASTVPRNSVCPSLWRSTTFYV